MLITIGTSRVKAASIVNLIVDVRSHTSNKEDLNLCMKAVAYKNDVKAIYFQTLHDSENFLRTKSPHKMSFY